MVELMHVPSSFSKSFSEALKIATPGGSWILISGQVGVPLRADAGPNTMAFADEVRTCFERIGESLKKCGASLSDIVRMDVFVTDLSLYGEFGRIRAELFPKDPPTSTAVQVAGLLLGARIEIGAVAFLDERK